MSETPEVHQRSIVVDGHCDTPYRLHRTGLRFDAPDPRAHVDLAMLESSGITASFFVSFVPSYYAGNGAARFANRLIDIIDTTTASHPDKLVAVRTAAGIRDAKASGRIAILIGIEGGHAIENSLETLVAFYERGARYLTLTHTNTNDWADSSGDEPRHGGLTAFGREVVRTMNDLGMIVDISHVADSTFYNALETSRAPIVATHSSCRQLCPHPRNLTDAMLRDLASAGGICMINFFSAFIDAGAAEILRAWKPSKTNAETGSQARDDAAAWDEWEEQIATLNCPTGTVDTLVDHFVHAASVAGVDHVGVGADFDGCSLLPAGLENAARLPRLTERMLERGFREGEIERILGANFVRVFEAIEANARR